MGAVFTVATAFLGRARERARTLAVKEAEQSRESLESLKAQLTDEAAPTDWDQIKDAVKQEESRQPSIGRQFFSASPHLLGVMHTVVIPGTTFLLATSKSGTLWDPRDQALDGGLVSSLRALL